MRDSSPINGAFAATLRALREARGLSQEAAASLCGVHRNYLGGLERAEKNPTLDTLARLATGFGVPLSNLLAEAERHLDGDRTRRS
jgi:transcriptional regulator with XRE-family HTH domain